jgi:hypothetical protein
VTVDFDARHRFAAPPEQVAAAMTDIDFVTSLVLPDVELAEVVGRIENANGVALRVRYRFVGRLDPVARRVLSGNRVSWVQEVRVDASMRRGTISVSPDIQADRMECRGTYRLEPTGAAGGAGGAGDGTGTTRSLGGALSVHVPLVGRRAEQHILPGVLRRIDIEAAAMQAHLTAGTA